MPKGVTYAVEGNTVRVKGPKGEVITHMPGGVSLEQQDGVLNVVREDDSKAAVHGLVRALVNNSVEGVTKGWTKELDIVGIGYRAEMKGKTRWCSPWDIRTRSNIRCLLVLRWLSIPS